jgi:predicted HNH restriction endonuclease
MDKDLDRWNRKQLAYVRRKALQERAINHLGGKCRICGYDKCVVALEFHHTSPQGKDFSISSGLTSWARVLPELEKCVLLCSNCHREVHDGLHVGYLELDGAWSSQYDLGEEDELELLDS